MSDNERKFWDWYNGISMHELLRGSRHTHRVARIHQAFETIKKQDAAEKKRQKRLAARTRRRIAARLAAAAPMAKQRRSNIDWYEVTQDRGVTMRQVAYERAQTALALRRTKATFAEIGKFLGVTKARAAIIVQKAERTRAAPIEQWMRFHVIAGPGIYTQQTLKHMIGALEVRMHPRWQP